MGGGDDIGIFQFQYEFAHALMLGKKNNNQTRVSSQDIFVDFDNTLTEIFHSMSFIDYSPELLDLPKEDLAIKVLSKLVQGHTQIVRNWGFINQVKNISRELFSKLDEDFDKYLGFSASELLDFFEMLLELLELRINVYRFEKEPINPIKELPTINNLFTFSISNMASALELDEKIILSIVDSFSMEFGSLKGLNPKHIIFNNPVWLKPLIKLDNNSFYCSAPQIFYSHILKALTELCEKDLKEKLEKTKASYLENKIAEIVSSRFPENKIFNSVKWFDDGREYETDLIINLDSYLVII